MPNAGYPDDDGSRDPAGQHDLGRQRVSCYDMQAKMTPATVADYMRNHDPVVNRSTSAGDETMPPARIPIDGDANSDGDYNVAAYPSYTSMG